MFAFASSHLRISLLAIFVLLLLGSSILFAQSAADVKKTATVSAPQSAWEIERERLLHEDWADLGHFRRANLSLSSPAANERRVVLMGDSITEGWRGTLQPEGPEMGAFFPGKPYINRGISGQTTPQMLVRFRQDVINLHPAVVVILAGTNDLAGNTGDTTLEAIEDNFADMCELARVHGIRVVLTSVLPTVEYPWRPDLQPAPRIAALNQWLRTYAATQHHIYLDLYSPMATPEGAMRPDLTPDGVHPNRAGYEVMAQLLQPAIDQALKK